MEFCTILQNSITENKPVNMTPDSTILSVIRPIVSRSQKRKQIGRVRVIRGKRTYFSDAFTGIFHFRNIN